MNPVFATAFKLLFFLYCLDTHSINPYNYENLIKWNE